MNPGAGIGEDGKMLAPSAFEVQLAAAKDFKEDGGSGSDILDESAGLPPTTAGSLAERIGDPECLQQYKDKVTGTDHSQT